MMRNLFLGSFLLFGSSVAYANDDTDTDYNLLDIRDLQPQACIHYNLDFKICALANEFSNFMNLVEMAQNTQDKTKKNNMKAQSKKIIKRICALYEEMGEANREYVLTNLGYKGDPILDKDDIVEFCY